MNWEARCRALESENDLLTERIAALESELRGERKFRAPLVMGLTHHEAGVLRVLYERKIATKRAIMDDLYSDRPNDIPEPKIVDVFVCKLRRKLRKFDVPITTVWGEGYTLTDDARRKIDGYA